MKAVCVKLTFFSSVLQQEGPSTSTCKHNQKEASDMRVGDSPLGSQAVTKNWIEILCFLWSGTLPLVWLAFFWAQILFGCHLWEKEVPINQRDYNRRIRKTEHLA
jgi:hypothetical protein